MNYISTNVWNKYSTFYKDYVLPKNSNQNSNFAYCFKIFQDFL